ncbi:MAG: hypothetical protein AAF957_24160 [Planctomycetota bacterium]
MQRASVTALAVTAIGVAFVAIREGGLDDVGMGALGGVLLGGVVGLMAHSLVATAMQLDAERSLRFVMAGFTVKAAGAVLPWGVFAFWAPARAFADPTAYLVGYAAAVLPILCAGVIDHLRLAAILSAERASGEASGGLNSSVSTGSSGSLESAS